MRFFKHWKVLEIRRSRGLRCRMLLAGHCEAFSMGILRQASSFSAITPIGRPHFLVLFVIGSIMHCQHIDLGAFICSAAFGVLHHVVMPVQE